MKNGTSEKYTGMKHISGLKQTYYCTLLLSVAKSAGSGRSTAIFFNRSYCDSSHSKMSSGKFKRFSDWSFDAESRLEKFPIDPVKENFVRRLVRNAVFSRVNPTPLETELKLVAASDDVLEKVMDLEPEEARLQCFAEFVAGNVLAKNSKPMAHRYGGHQFGYWADQLGDGRAHILGEYTNRDGKRWELQLKGSGKTPYSRGGDGRAVLRSSVREFLCSEAMNALGIPTSRAAALVVSNDPVIRDRFYTGKIEVERAAVVLCIAPSWFRIGSLEICTKYKETEILRQITDFVIDNYYPNINGPAKYLDFFKKVFGESVSLVAKWMSVGFAHGVLNTDNLSLLSITIDYGPFGFLDEYNPYFIPNSSDDEGRYSYVNQPAIFEWNLWQLANALSPLLTEAEKQEIETVLGSFDSIYEESFLENMGKKLGFAEPFEKRKLLIDSLLDMMELLRSDFTQTFRQLGKVSLDAEDFSDQWAIEPLAKHRNFADFINLYKSCLEDQGISEDTRRTRMNQANPQYVLRNWMAEAAIREANQDSFELTRLLLKILTDPYHEDPEAEELGFSRKPPTWSKCLKVSCSS